MLLTVELYAERCSNTTILNSQLVNLDNGRDTACEIRGVEDNRFGDVGRFLLPSALTDARLSER